VINSQTLAQSFVDQVNYGGVQVSLNETTANSQILASNEEYNSISFGGLYPWSF